MAEPDPFHHPPDGILRPHTQPRGGLSRHASPLSLLVLGTVVSLGLSGVLGHAGMQRDTYRSDAASHSLDVEMPTTIRTGDFYETRLRVRAGADIAKLQIAVPASLWREVTINAMVPQPESESSDGEQFQFDFGPLAAGKERLVKISAQVNPRLHGTVSGELEVMDGDRVLLRAPRQLRVLP